MIPFVNRQVLFVAASSLHITNQRFFHFMKRQVTIDPEIAKMREARKRRKLEKAIIKLTEFSKKPKPVEEMRMEPRHRDTLAERRRRLEELEGGAEMDEYRATIIRKNHSRTLGAMAKADQNWIKKSMEAQRKTLDLLRIVSPALYEAAVQPDDSLKKIQFEGPALTPPIPGYKSPDGDYADATKKWALPVMPLLEKKLAVGRLIKAPAYTKKKEGEGEKEMGEENRQSTARGPGNWLKGEIFGAR